jgi:NTE family protein
MQRRSFLTVATVAAASSVPRAASATVGPSIGFALGSGALHSWAHVGIVRGCARVGLRPQAIAASGVGAVVGALWAAGKSAEGIVSVAQRLKWPSTAPGLTALLGGAAAQRCVREEIDRAVGGLRVQGLPVRFASVASDALTGDSVVVDSGPVGLAVEASYAVPVANEPVPIGNRQLLDGALTAPVPVAAVRQLGAERVVAVDVAYRPYEEAPTSASDYAYQAMHIIGNALAREQRRQAEHVIKLDVHHFMRRQLDVDALIEAGEAALLQLAPRLAPQ